MYFCQNLVEMKYVSFQLPHQSMCNSTSIKEQLVGLALVGY